MLAIHSVAELIAAHEAFVGDLAESLAGAISRNEVPDGDAADTVRAAIGELRASVGYAGLARELLVSVGA